ncbi:MAG: hypothetical protein A3B91_05115 [Candidatus Yanofskybacteria bacterium RIFCSPHIGHO2_02_FULL_41_29]|uniref:Uncharacterized protein n=1 Tax=Candidatus Yanofskybacteria bacterium RIFCSPHIGHO2_01_FULL_41_53 TaxID=1802663 RepID=A0A1F8EKY7_9BACT|nr:MAG: hypothetical protein A2650_04115 [Candidatus Yanofskybacteria bacterium RIFCSPHIGHO2_01_FULL_41_53]OGN11671.1 MAG: hypothetical protein A3B91_05115 [Candidatus Yanofskybacteria bacterium RIFCSPHIGHO2_02_FULL_41_29]OGN17896.1 MAG: hypothetical protein A3F48_01955 [Candidatus Yanofskybacteria bacterium RIFCSPHIGHO2_12_FULL_41_9]OGN23431.1 MAG: hypothetical protein A2916_03505 [Candidatus Yanofskybacteria bacterium RIFCSPLOWO2_01_FULL_41_67]OGN30308.1 MAG: hypothetical protein A3H54_04495 
MERERIPRVDDFLRRIKAPGVIVPDSAKDFGMYERMDQAFEGLHDRLEELRRNYGRLGYSAQNLMSDLSKAFIEATQNGDEEDMAFFDHDMDVLTEGFEEVTAEGEIAEVGNRFSRTIWQERHEAELFNRIWSVIIGVTDQIPNLTPWQTFGSKGGNVQAFLYGYLDVVSELAKAVTDEQSKISTVEEEFRLFERYLAVASSIALKLSEYRHVPGYVINNAYGRWAAYTTKLRTVYGTIAHVRREYNLRRSIQRMIKATITRLEDDGR